MKTWFAVPSAAPLERCNQVFAAWQEFGCKVAVLIDRGAPKPSHCDLIIEDEYRGYPAAVKKLCDEILRDDKVQVIVTGGDDILPDPSMSADRVTREFLERFPNTFGVMQPIGDDWMPDGGGMPASARVNGSPWMGRAFIQRINGGVGPFWPDYFAYYSDEEQHDVCQMLGILHQRPDICQYHDHWTRRGETRPHYLNKAQANWDACKELFNHRKLAGFPGHQPLP